MKVKSESEVSLPPEQTKSAEAGVSVKNHTRPSVLSGGGSGDQREVQIRMRDGGEMQEESSNFHPVRVSHYKLFFFHLCNIHLPGKKTRSEMTPV